jgi:hypothetical protein
MKIKDIKSDEVREEAVRLLQHESYKRDFISRMEALDFALYAFYWDTSPQGREFWHKLNSGTTPNTPDLKLPEKNPSE